MARSTKQISCGKENMQTKFQVLLSCLFIVCNVTCVLMTYFVKRYLPHDQVTVLRYNTPGGSPDNCIYIREQRARISSLHYRVISIVNIYTYKTEFIGKKENKSSAKAIKRKKLLYQLIVILEEMATNYFQYFLFLTFVLLFQYCALIDACNVSEMHEESPARPTYRLTRSILKKMYNGKD